MADTVSVKSELLQTDVMLIKAKYRTIKILSNSTSDPKLSQDRKQLYNIISSFDSFGFICH